MGIRVVGGKGADAGAGAGANSVGQGVWNGATGERGRGVRKWLDSSTGGLGRWGAVVGSKAHENIVG